MSLIYKWCSHEKRIFLVIYKSQLNSSSKRIDESPKLLCKSCCNDCDFVNNSEVSIIFDTTTGKEITPSKFLTHNSKGELS